MALTTSTKTLFELALSGKKVTVTKRQASGYVATVTDVRVNGVEVGSIVEYDTGAIETFSADSGSYSIEESYFIALTVVANF